VIKNITNTNNAVSKLYVGYRFHATFNNISFISWRSI